VQAPRGHVQLLCRYDALASIAKEGCRTWESANGSPLYYKSATRLEVGRSIDGTRVVVLVKSRPEGSATSSWTRSLLTDAGANSGTAHKVSDVVILGVSFSGADSPCNNSNGTDQDGTTNTDNDTNDNVLLIRR
jgi:hypothetical protein